MSEFIRLQANGADAYPDASTENTYRPNGTSVENALLDLESNVNTLGGVAGEAKTLAEQNSVKIATAEQEISDINSSLEDIFKPKNLIETEFGPTNANEETTLYTHTFTKETLVNAYIKIIADGLTDSKICNGLIYHNNNKLTETQYNTSGTLRQIMSFSILEKFNVGDTLTLKFYSNESASARVIIMANYSN